MIGQHHRLSGHESEQTPGDSAGQRRLAYHSPWGHKELVGHSLATEQQQFLLPHHLKTRGFY